MSLKIYYLDDEPELLDMFVDAFSVEGIEIFVFSVPAAAIKAVKSNPPDLFFIDYRLPNTTGDVIALELDPEIPKVLITGELNPKCQADFIAKLAKPYRLKEVKDLIELAKMKGGGKKAAGF